MSDQISPPAASPLRGVFWMVVTGMLFVGVTALVKWLGTRVPAPQAAFMRYGFGLVMLLPVLASLLRLHPGRRVWALFLARGVLHTVGVAMWFFAMARITIADVTAMGYLAPVYVTLGAAIFLGERLALRRLLAVAAALLGALIILRPGLREIEPGHVAMLVTALCFGASYLMAKPLVQACGAAQVVAMLSVSVTIGLAPAAAANWVAPTWAEVAILATVAAIATTGHYTMMLAFRAAPLAVTQPVTFLQLVWAVLLGVLVFGEPLDPWVVLGGTVIVAAVSFISLREAQLKRRAVTPPVPATKY